ncbi:MAG: hypothetical protein L0332_35790 [Chloroflexi bacterium]|nr:hypothetical protein [Chloroflexota bacterium]
MKDKNRILQRLPIKVLGRFLPTPGNVFFTLLISVIFAWAQNAGAISRLVSPATTSTNTIAYQGRLEDTNGNPLAGTYEMTFRLYDEASGGNPLWTEQWSGSNAVEVSDGLFNVLLGSLTPIPPAVFNDNSTLWLGLKVGTDSEMMPRVQLGSVPYTFHAESIASGAVESRDLNLDNGTDCLTANVVVNLPGSSQRVPISDLTLNFSLTEANQVLIWMDGYAGNNDGSLIGEGGIDLLVDDQIIGGQYERTEQSTTWEIISVARLVSLDSGNHSIEVEAFSEQPGTFNMSGQFETWQTCISYLVLGEG